MPCHENESGESKLCSLCVLMLLCERRAPFLTHLGLLPHKTVREQPWAQQISLQDRWGRAKLETQNDRRQKAAPLLVCHLELLLPRFPACWLPVLDLENWHFMRLGFIVNDKNLNSFVWVKDNPFVVSFVQHQLSTVPTGWGPDISYIREDN